MFSELHPTPHLYDKDFPRFGNPKIIGYMSLYDSGKYHADASQVKFANNIQEKNVKYDLNIHMDKTQHRIREENEKIPHLLQFLLDQEIRLCLPVSNDLELARFFCYRGLMTNVACTPYENQEPWRIVATLFKGNIYLCALDTQCKIDRMKNMTEKDKIFGHWGYKFEQFLLSDSPDSQPNPDAGFDENDEFNLVFTTNLNRHTVVYGGEMDGIINDGSLDSPPSQEKGPDAIIQYLSSKKYIELKTNRHIEFPKQETNFRRFKTKKWWLQSYLAGIETILCGFRNDAGIVEQLKIYRTNDIARMSKRFWNPSVCMNFLDTFLTYVKRCLAKKITCCHGEKALKNLQSLPLIHLHFEWSPGTPVRVTDSYNYENDPILPDWFVQNYGHTRLRVIDCHTTTSVIHR